jgi:glucose/arabinose dehydrogenase
MRIRPLLLTASSLIVAAAVWYNVDWGFNALRLYMAASQPLEAGEPPHRETAGEVEFIATALTDQLDMPWSFAFMPGGDILVSERGGTLQRLDPDTGELAPVTGVPDVFYKGQGGLLDVALHPGFPETPWI